MPDTQRTGDAETDLNDLRMSESVRPLFEHVKKFIAETVNPMSVEFHRLGEGNPNIWTYAPGQLECLEKAKDEASSLSATVDEILELLSKQSYTDGNPSGNGGGFDGSGG